MSTNNLPPPLEEPLLEQDPNPKDTILQDSLADDDDDDESGETVSLCDLPIYGYDTVYETSCDSDSEDTTIKGDENFEFFSEEYWKKKDKDSNFFPPKDIVFCGNLIPPKPKQPISRNKVDINSGIASRNREFAKLMSMNKGRNHGGKHEKKTSFPVAASGSKKSSRWYNYGVGLAGIPREMDLGAIRSRQINHRRKNQVEDGGGEKESGGFRHRKGLGGLMRDLSCNGQNQANSMVKASLVCIPRV